MATQLATTETQPMALSAEAERFSLMQRQARMFAMSPLIPEALRKGTPEQAMANCYIAMSIADRMGEDRMTVMQNIHIIHGTAGFKSSYMIARANASGKFSEEIDWEESDEGGNLKVTAFATLAKNGRRVEMSVDMAMAKAEGWTNNKKYSTMPKVMLRYRSAAFLIRLYAPEVMLGHQTLEEVEDVGFAGSIPVHAARPLTAAMLTQQAQGEESPVEEIAERVGEAAEIVEGSADEQHGETMTLESAKAEIDSAELVLDVNSRMMALLPLLPDDQQSELLAYASARVAELEGR